MYLKLGKQASCFYDAATGVDIVNKQAIEYNGPITKRLASALKHGAIEEVRTEGEYLKLKADFDASNAPASKESKKEAAKAEKVDPQAELKDKLHKMSDEELLAYYKDNFEVGEEEEAAFNKLKSKKAKISFLTEEE